MRDKAIQQLQLRNDKLELKHDQSEFKHHQLQVQMAEQNTKYFQDTEAADQLEETVLGFGKDLQKNHFIASFDGKDTKWQESNESITTYTGLHNLAFLNMLEEEQYRKSQWLTPMAARRKRFQSSCVHCCTTNSKTMPRGWCQQPKIKLDWTCIAFYRESVRIEE